MSISQPESLWRSRRRGGFRGAAFVPVLSVSKLGLRMMFSLVFTSFLTSRVFVVCAARGASWLQSCRNRCAAQVPAAESFFCDVSCVCSTARLLHPCITFNEDWSRLTDNPPNLTACRWDWAPSSHDEARTDTEHSWAPLTRQVAGQSSPARSACPDRSRRASRSLVVGVGAACCCAAAAQKVPG